MIILEGPDASGKTTLAKHLCEKYDLEYSRAPRLSPDHGPLDLSVVEWWDATFRGGVKANHRKVFDRCFFIGEFIYSLATPGRELMVDAKRMSLGFLRMIQLADLIVFCKPPWETQRQTLQDHNRAALHGVDLLQLEKIAWAYRYVEMMLKEIMYEQVVGYDWTSMSRQFIDSIIEEDLLLVPDQ